VNHQTSEQDRGHRERETDRQTETESGNHEVNLLQHKFAFDFDFRAIEGFLEQKHSPFEDRMGREELRRDVGKSKRNTGRSPNVSVSIDRFHLSSLPHMMKNLFESETDIFQTWGADTCAGCIFTGGFDL
jgi:hypothetical protein